MSLRADKKLIEFKPDDVRVTNVRSIAEILLEYGYTTPNDVAKALAKQNKSDASLGEILLADKGVTAYNLQKAISFQSKMELESDPFTTLPAASNFPISISEMLEFNFAPVSTAEQQIKLAIADPANISNITDICERAGFVPQFVISSRKAIHAHIADIGKKYLSGHAENICPDRYSCRGITEPSRNYFLLSAIVVFIGILVFAGYMEYVLFVIALTTFLGNAILKFACFSAYLFKKPQLTAVAKTYQKLERVSILVPLFKESHIVERLINRLTELDYPKELLEILLICEEEDVKTQKRILDTMLPSHIRMVVAPSGIIQTKPRAMNYALNFCKGSIIGVYDAEDAPEYDQVYKAVRHLQNADPRVVCVQARLDFFNQGTNWLARCFTIEYAILFRVILQGLQRLDLPIPLGGTSMFIRREALVKWGQWDAHNVTEDADLGIRLFRQGLRVECLDSTTYEEANYKFHAWIKQRSRWLKGFMMTWLTHMRTPRKLITDLGFASFMAFNALLLGTVVTYLVIPLLLPYWLLSFGFIPPIIGNIPYGALPIMVIILALGEPFLALVGYYATKTAKHRKLRFTLLTMFAYWPLASFAAYKAVYELMTSPTYWDKTEHGLNDQQYSCEIETLTLPAWRQKD